MQVPRRFLPSLPLLTAFEAAARTGSITAASRELDLTQSAVSRQIKALEQQIGVELFHRERQTIKLTVGGEGYARDVREALRRISNASLNLRANPKGGSLHLAVLPTFGARWLAPRLPSFNKSHPNTIINIITKTNAVDLFTDQVDGVIDFGKPDFETMEFAFLKRENIIPVCSPELLQRYPINCAADIRLAPLIHLVSRPNAWERWMVYHNIAFDSVHGVLFDQFETIIRSAVAGLGFALVPEFIVREELDSGKLLRPVELGLEAPEFYYLAWLTERAAYWPLLAFKDWLKSELLKE
ncbi:LysR family transcriptional regulator [Ochrobactrum sp. S46]|nr:LysR family transcriptional regulator [Ochrobactrum sp. S45]MBK0046375.1 LysR family transcriptional regulator [Ochrobactrum sp. S46]